MIKNTIRHAPPWAFWDDLFSDEEIDKITAYCQEQTLQKGTVVAGKGDPQGRVSDIGFVFPNVDTGWFFEKMNSIIEQINDQWYGFDLEGYLNFQYTEYDAAKNAHYGMHMDLFLGKPGPARKLSLSLILNDDYEGGEFYVQDTEKPTVMPQKKGRLIMFPAFMLHGVRPVSNGVRRSIVIWVSGPMFR
jgi:PKHD-type hydroxylase